MSDSVLPIDDINEREFNEEFKRKHLDNKVLSKEDLDEIEKLFGLDQKGLPSKAAQMCCDEMHGHEYKCIWYKRPESGVVDRLIDEIKYYKLIIKKASEYLNKGN